MNLFATIKNKLKKDIVLEISLSGEIPEENEKLSIPFIKNKDKTTVFDLETIFHYIKKNKVKAVLFNIGSLGIGLSRANEIRNNIASLSELKIESYVYLENPGNLEYFIASAADQVYMPKWSTLNLIGLSSETFFLKDFFEKIYVEPEIEGKGNYKSAAEIFSRNKISEYNREMINSIMDYNFNLIKFKIADSRNINSLLEMEKIFNEGPYLCDTSLKSKLIDRICYYNEIKDFIKNKYGENTSFISDRKVLKSIKFKNTLTSLYYKLLNKRHIVAVVSIDGMITDGESRRGSGYIKTSGSASVIKNLKNAEENKNVAAIVVRVLSPGGSALASDLIRNEIMRINEKKPVVVSMSDVAASGGYMLSLSADRIFADEFTLTGSIGVVSGKFNFSKLLKFLDINHETISRGKNASIYSLFEKFTADELKVFRSMLDIMYKNFVELVSKCRNIDVNSVESAAQGRVLTGGQALDQKLIDETGSLQNVLEYVKNRIGLDKENMPVLKFYRTKIDLGSLGKQLALNHSALFPILEKLSGENILALMPFFIRYR